jgi:hypothetical protein
MSCSPQVNLGLYRDSFTCIKLFLISLQILFGTFIILRRIQRDVIINLYLLLPGATAWGGPWPP